MKVKNWWELCALREEYGGETPSQEEFAADIWKVRIGKALPIYQDQEIFFDRTYASPDLKKLVRIVLRRLCSLDGGKPIIRTQVAYGGGKSHAMLILYHLCSLQPDLIENPTVKSFFEFAGIEQPPPTRIAILSFDKFDVHEGLEVLDADDNKKVVMSPWAALAYQLGGEELFRKVIKHEKTGISPAQPLMEEILSFPQRLGFSTLVIIDEASIYGRSLYTVGKFGPFKDFFQYLTQAASALEKVVIVATLLHTGMERADAVGQRVLTELTMVFDRMGPESIEPIKENDVAEVLRKRLFEELPSEEERKKIANKVIAAWQMISNVSHSEMDKYLEERILKSYPFHPDFIETLYSRWIELPKFQRTRGALQLLSIILRDGRRKDQSILIGTSCLLGPKKQVYSQGLITLIDWTDDGATWSGIIQHELNLAQRIQNHKLTLKHREIEQLVLSVFLLSQPEGRKGNINDILRILIHPDLQEISSLRSSIEEWRSQSWYFDDSLTEQEFALIKKKNIISMHDSIINSLTPEQIIDVQNLMEEEIGKMSWVPDMKKSFVKLHCLTKNPESVDDTAGIHLAIIEPKPIIILNQKHIPEEIKEIFEYSTNSKKARIYKNGLLVICPDSKKLPLLYEKCSSIIAWKILKKSPDFKKFSKDLQTKVNDYTKQDKQSINELVRSTYSIVFLFMPNEEIENRPIKPNANVTPYDQIIEILRQEDRILEELKPDKLLPQGGLNLWNLESKSLSVSFLIKMFYRFPRLPFPEDPDVIFNAVNTLLQEGKVVLKISRPDNSYKTFWRDKVEINQLLNENSELLLIDDATISSLPDDLLVPNSKVTLWPPSAKDINYSYLLAKFDGISIPKLESETILQEKIKTLSKEKKLCITIKNKAYCGDVSIDSQDLEECLIALPPPEVRMIEFLNDSFEDTYWKEGEISFKDIINGIATIRGYKIPLSYLIEPLSNAINTNKIELASTDMPWPPEESSNLNMYKFRIKIKEIQQKPIKKGKKQLKILEQEAKEPILISQSSDDKAASVQISTSEEELKTPQTINLNLTPSVAELDDLAEFIQKINELGAFTWNLELRLDLSKDQISEDLLTKINDTLQKYWPDKKFQLI